MLTLSFLIIALVVVLWFVIALVAVLAVGVLRRRAVVLNAAWAPRLIGFRNVTLGLGVLAMIATVLAGDLGLTSALAVLIPVGCFAFTLAARLARRRWA
jgi:hypothetical protein